MQFSILSRVTASAAALLAASLLAGCSITKPKEDPTRFYVLRSPEASSSGTSNSAVSKRWRVNLRPVEIPSYLKPATIVVRMGSNEISYADFHRWAEPLDQAIARVCKETLARTPTVDNVSLGARAPAEIDCELTVRLLACEGIQEKGGAASIRFRAAWELRTLGHQALLRREVFEAPATTWNGTDYGQLAERLSTAVNQLAQTLAAAFAQEP
jgi:uncharacterized lipoprotein YmbA